MCPPPDITVIWPVEKSVHKPTEMPQALRHTLKLLLLIVSGLFKVNEPVIQAVAILF